MPEPSRSQIPGLQCEDGTHRTFAERCIQLVRCEKLKTTPVQGLNPTLFSLIPPSLGMSSPSVTTQPELTQPRPGTYTRIGHCRVSTASMGLREFCHHSGPRVMWHEKADTCASSWPGGPCDSWLPEGLKPSRHGSPCKTQVRHKLISKLVQLSRKGHWYKTKHMGEEGKSVSKVSHHDKTLRGLCKASSNSVRGGYHDITLH